MLKRSLQFLRVTAASAVVRLVGSAAVARARGLQAGAPSDWRNEVSGPAAAVALLTVAVGSVTAAARLAWHALPLLLVPRLLRVFKSTRL